MLQQLYRMSSLGFLFRFIKRVAILIPGIIITAIAAKSLYPALDVWLPAGVVVLILYILVAYLLIPAAIRLINLIIQPKHIPLYSTTPDGLACDPMNVGVVATRQELITLMKKAGWHQAHPRTPKNLLRFLWAIILKQSYPNAPFSTLFLFGRGQDLGFQLPVDDNPGHRHHIRFWGVTETDDPEYRQHAFFWLRHHRSPKRGRVLWVGAASLDIGLGIIRHNAQITHMIHHDTNAERDFVVKQLKQTGLIKKSRTITVGRPYRLPNRVINGYMQADGRMTICEI